MSSSCSVIVVEDDPDMGGLYKLCFINLDIHSIVFTDPLIALEHFQQHHYKYKVALLDWTLPRIDGLELARRMRQYSSDIKILLLTGYSNEYLNRNPRFVEAKISDVLSKPMWLDEIGSHIMKLCTE